MSKTILNQRQIPDETIQKLRAFFEEKKDVSLAFIFGSIVSGHISGHSDVDVAVLFKEAPALDDVLDIKEALTLMFNREADIVVLNEASPVVKMQVLKNGKLIFQRSSNDYSMLYGMTVKQYDDLKIVRKECEDNILKGRIYAR